MEGKLIKESETFFKLRVNDVLYAMNMEIDPYSGQSGIQKLSLENCKSIENGYDLIELCIEKYGYPNVIPTKSMIGHFELQCRAKGFLIGFELRDKMFPERIYTEADLRKAMDLNRKALWTQDEVVKSLKQTEWDVEIVTERNASYINGGEICLHEEYKPKLDSKGKLILRLKQPKQ